MKDWYFRRQLKSSNVCVGLYTTRISDFVFHRRRCRFPNSLMEQRCDAPLFEVVQVATHDVCNAPISLRSGAILGEGECLINFRRSRKKREEKNAKNKKGEE